jgi:tRNA nucleotidyltransferase/poly(A) polymerase
MFNIGFSFINKIKRNLFPFYKNKELKFVFNKLQEGLPASKVAARFVGGCVRKYLSDEKIDDIDVATILSAEEIKNKFENTNFKVVETGIKHGTVTLVSKSLKLELTTLRKDVETDGRHAEVEYINNWQLDSERRDFTINAIYLDINGNIFDPQMGTVDLKNNNVKFIGDPEKRIQEDYLRIIRLLRFAIQYDSSNDKTTIDAVKLNLSGLKKISKERILGELMKMLNFKTLGNILNHPNKKDIFLKIFPELKNLNRLGRLKKIRHRIKLNNFDLISLLITDNSDNYEYFAFKYNIPNDLKEDLLLSHKCFKSSKNDKFFFKRDLKKNIYFYGKQKLLTINTILFCEKLNFEMNEYFMVNKKINSTQIPKLKFDGRFLVSKGLSPGPKIGIILKEIEDEWVTNDFEISSNRVIEIINSNKY